MNPNCEEALFALALEKPAERRTAFLNVMCEGDPALRARLDVLLAAHDQAETLLATQAVRRDELHDSQASPSSSQGLTELGPPMDETVGQTLGRYKLLERVGEGGCGVVYVAEQSQPVRRRVALKVIKLGMDTKQVVARFEAERQALAMMDHPNICKVFDAGTTETGRPFFVMELVRGIKITDYCDQANLSTKERLDLFTKVCQAIQHAHQKGIIHRDIKPSNILVTLHDGVPVPKVIDFGIAKATEGRLTDNTVYTQLHQFIGTPAYMSPEQAEMSGLDIDTRSDIYSLGVLLYELLAGSTPFDARELMASGLDAMRKTIREKEPPRPSTRLATLGADQLTTTAKRRSANTSKLMHQLKGDLDWIVMKCLEKDRQRRYDTANGLAADIRRHLEKEPVVARPPSLAYRMQKFVGKHRFGVLAGSAVLAALLLGFTLAVVGFVRAKADRDIAVNARIEAQAQKKLADDQRQMAVGNAKKADENARDAKLQLAHGLIAQADAFSLANRFWEAHQLYTDAYDKFVELKQPLRVPEAGLWSSYHQATYPLLKFTGHTGGVHSVAISPDGRRALSASYDKTLKLWDLATGTELRAFTGHMDRVESVAISPDGRTALSGSLDETLKLWDLASGKELRTFAGHTDGVVSVAISPDGRTALSGGYDRTLKLWDLASGKELRAFAGHTQPVWSVALSPDGRTALSGSMDKTLKFWDLASGKELRAFAGHTQPVWSVAISPDGRTALSGSVDKTLNLWDLASGKEVRTFTGHSREVRSVAISPDSRTALSGSDDKTLKLWDLATGKELRTFTGHTDIVWSVAISPDGRTALSGGFDMTLKHWDLAGGKELRAFIGHTGGVLSVAISPDGRTALSGSHDKTLKLWDLATGKELRAFAGHSGAVSSVAISPDGRTALSGSRDKTLKLWDLASGKELRTFAGHTQEVSSVAISPDGRTALSGSRDTTLKLWDLASGKELRNFIGHTGGVLSLAISPDGRTALSGGSMDKTLKLWDLASGKELRTFTGHNDYVCSVAISPDGRTALSGAFDNTLKLWDFARGPAQREFEPKVSAAQEKLRQSADDPASLATLGEWYVFRGMDPWAVELLAKARERGAAVAPMSLARCYWNLDRLPEARKEFQIALEQSKDAAEQAYLVWCIAGIDTEPQRKH